MRVASLGQVGKPTLVDLAGNVAPAPFSLGAADDGSAVPKARQLPAGEQFVQSESQPSA